MKIRIGRIGPHKLRRRRFVIRHNFVAIQNVKLPVHQRILILFKQFVASIYNFWGVFGHFWNHLSMFQTFSESFWKLFCGKFEGSVCTKACHIGRIMYVNHVSKERTSREPLFSLHQKRNEDTQCNDIQGIEDIRKLMVFLTNFLEFLITSFAGRPKSWP